MRAVPVVLVCLLPALVACAADELECVAEGGRPCVVIGPGPDAYVHLQTALIEARPGDVLLLLEGLYELRLGLALDADRVTIRGQGIDRTVLSFRDQLDGAQGLLVTGDDFLIEDLAIEDTAGDGLKIEGTRGVTIRRVRVEWTGGPSAQNGAYGLYPVQCRDVLIEDSVAIGASDAGIYVGQSQGIVVRRNRAHDNVAGIEIENSFDADVYGNRAVGNTGGVLVFNLPGLPVANGRGTRVFENAIYGNNTPNFAPPGNIVGKVPQGTGFAAIAAHELEVFDNHIGDNQTVNAAVISYLLTELPFDDPGYDPYSDTVYFHGNVFTGGGTEPSGELGFLLVQSLVRVIDIASTPMPDIVFDGHLDPEKSDGGALLPEYAICARDNRGAIGAFLDAPNGYDGAHLDPASFDCAHPPLDPVVLGGAR